ncbi:MAG: hypothetical protein ACRCXB_30130 [Aeromonadaceae bacterium]
MSDEKMREEFEAWASSNGYELGVSDDARFTYDFHETECAWCGWKASRAVLCVEFIKPRETDSSGLPCYDEYWREDIEDMLDAAGVRYK